VVDQETIAAVMREFGARGGKRRMQTLTKKERADLGREAGKKSGEARRKKAAEKKKAAAKTATKPKSTLKVNAPARAFPAPEKKASRN
jgi:hypothetical protein